MVTMQRRSGPPPSISIAGGAVNRVNFPSAANHYRFKTAAAQQHSCSFPAIRQEWRKMSSVTQSRFLDAVNCLMNTESILDLNHKVSRSVFDDFAFAHFSLVNKVHGTAQFLPWHRTLILLFEFALQDFCSYSGTLPYWDWTLDAQNPSMSPIFSDSAFGGNGQSPSNCIQTGCFSNATVIINHESPKCITRNFQQLNNGMLGSAYSSSIVENLVGTSTWGPFSQTIYSGPHAAVHNALGGDFSFPPAAGNDPLFYVHHSMIDKIWSDWQHMNPSQAATYYGNRDPSMPNAVDAELTDYLAGNSPLIGNWTLFPPIRVQDALWSDGGVGSWLHNLGELVEEVSTFLNDFMYLSSDNNIIIR